ncbi:MAG: TolC family protein [Mariprofundales bacterium]|nr:TolC family protein [Mariprofundales bacterium]
MILPTQIRQLLVPVALLATVSIPLSSWSAESTTLSLQRAEQLALQHNPALTAAGKRAEAMAAAPPQVGSLPDPTVSFKALNLPVDSFSTTQESMTQLQVGLSQSVPFPGKLKLKSQAAEELAAAALANEQELRLVVLRNTRIHWWNLAYLDKALTIIRRNQSLLRNFVHIAEIKYKTGKGLQQDVLLAQLELSKLLQRKLKLQGARQREEAELNALLGRAADQPAILPAVNKANLIEVTSDLPTLKRWARTHRPMLQAMNHLLDAADFRLALAERDYYPDFNIGAAYGIRSGVNPATGRSRADITSIMVSMSLPIYTSSRQDRAVDQRIAEKEVARFRWQDAANHVDANIDAAASDLRTAHDQVVLYEKGILPQARQTTTSMLAGYQVNKVDFLNLVRAQLSEFNLDIQYWQQVSAYNQAAARLAAAAGREQIIEEIDSHE